MTEFKSLDSPTHAAVNNALLRGMRQARRVIVDGRPSGLGELNARRGLARFRGGMFADRLDMARIIGAAFDDIVWERAER